jgi:hypothetical protein
MGITLRITANRSEQPVTMGALQVTLQILLNNKYSPTHYVLVVWDVFYLAEYSYLLSKFSYR